MSNRTVQLKVMLTPDEHAALASAADAAGESVSLYVRWALREAMRRDVQRRQRAKTPGVE